MYEPDLSEEDDTIYPDFSAPLPDLPAYIDSTMLATFRACPRKFLYQYVYNLKPKGTSIDLVAGGAMAAALEAARILQGTTPDAPQHHEDLCNAAMKAFLPYVLEWPEDEDHQKNPHNMFHAVELYLQEFHPYYDEVQLLYIGEDKKPSTEFSFAIPLAIEHPNGQPFLYVGRFDMLAKYKPNDALVVFDDKTTKSLGPYWLKQFDLRGQFAGYLWACKQLGYAISNTVVVRGTGLLKTETNFLTFPLEFPDHVIERWHFDLYQSINLMLYYHQQGHYPYNFGDSCSSYGGCPMSELCKARNPQNFVTNFKVEIWNPLASEET